MRNVGFPAICPVCNQTIDGEKPLPKSSSVPTRFLRLKLVRQLSRLKDIDANTSKRRELLSAAQRVHLPALPTGLRELEERYSFRPCDLKFIDAHTKRNFKYGKEFGLLVGGSARACHEERWTSTKKQRVPAPVFAAIAPHIG
jgi:hypothetical protein